MNYSGLPKNPAPGVMIVCPSCGKECSAHARDYRNVPGHLPIECSPCGDRMHLVQRRVRYVRISPKKAEARL